MKYDQIFNKYSNDKIITYSHYIPKYHPLFCNTFPNNYLRFIFI